MDDERVIHERPRKFFNCCHKRSSCFGYKKHAISNQIQSYQIPIGKNWEKLEKIGKDWNKLEKNR